MTPRLVHPVAWWLWAIGMAAASMRTRDPLLLLLIIAVVSYVVSARRIDAIGGGAFGLTWRLGVLTVVLTISLQAVLGVRYPGTTLVSLPEVVLPQWTGGVSLGGDVTIEALVGASTNGLRLAAIIVCFGAANALAHPTRLLAVLPAALYELGVAAVVAITLLPRLAESLTRVRKAQRMRGRSVRGLHGLHGLLVPVLEDALDRAVGLAASMDSRGYGRRGDVSPVFRAWTGGSVLVGLLGACYGTYSIIDPAADQQRGIAVLVGGAVLAAAGALIAGRRTARTALHRDPWRLPEWLVMGAGIGVGFGYRLLSGADVVGPLGAQWPRVSLAAIGVTLIGVLAGLLVPPPPRTAAAGHPAAVPAPSAAVA
jgi:energy-coupling factor transport system permease protein